MDRRTYTHILTNIHTYTYIHSHAYIHIHATNTHITMIHRQSKEKNYFVFLLIAYLLLIAIVRRAHYLNNICYETISLVEVVKIFIFLNSIYTSTVNGSRE